MSDQQLHQQHADTVAAAANQRAQVEALAATQQRELADFYARERARQQGSGSS